MPLTKCAARLARGYGPGLCRYMDKPGLSVK